MILQVFFYLNDSMGVLGGGVACLYLFWFGVFVVVLFFVLLLF